MAALKLNSGSAVRGLGPRGRSCPAPSAPRCRRARRWALVCALVFPRLSLATIVYENAPSPGESVMRQARRGGPHWGSIAIQLILDRRGVIARSARREDRVILRGVAPVSAKSAGASGARVVEARRRVLRSSRYCRRHRWPGRCTCRSRLRARTDLRWCVLVVRRADRGDPPKELVRDWPVRICRRGERDRRRRLARARAGGEGQVRRRARRSRVGGDLHRIREIGDAGAVARTDPVAPCAVHRRRVREIGGVIGDAERSCRSEPAGIGVAGRPGRRACVQLVRGCVVGGRRTGSVLDLPSTAPAPGLSMTGTARRTGEARHRDRRP